MSDPAITLNGFDDVTLSVIEQVTRTPTVVGCYPDGGDANLAQARSMFPKAFIVDYSRGYNGTIKSRAADYERGCMDATQLVDWMKLNINSVPKPIAYCAVSDAVSVVDNILAPAGFARDKYFLNVAHDTGRPHFCGPTTCGYNVPGGSDGTQWTFAYNGLNLDANIWHADVFGPPPPPPDPLHYLWYPLSPFLMDTKKGKVHVSERLTVMKYDHLRHHAHMNEQELNELRANELLFLRKRIWYVSHFDVKTGKPLKTADWSNHRHWRWEELLKRTSGQVVNN